MEKEIIAYMLFIYIKKIPKYIHTKGELPDVLDRIPTKALHPNDAEKETVMETRVPHCRQGKRNGQRVLRRPDTSNGEAVPTLTGGRGRRRCHLIPLRSCPGSQKPYLTLSPPTLPSTAGALGSCLER